MMEGDGWSQASRGEREAGPVFLFYREVLQRHGVRLSLIHFFCFCAPSIFEPRQVFYRSVARVEVHRTHHSQWQHVQASKEKVESKAGAWFALCVVFRHPWSRPVGQIYHAFDTVTMSKAVASDTCPLRLTLTLALVVVSMQVWVKTSVKYWYIIVRKACDT